MTAVASTPHPMAALTGRCACGCGRRPPQGRRYVPSHRYGHTRASDYIDDDSKAIAYWTGAIDARNQRPRRVDVADTSTIGDAYTRGYEWGRWHPYTASLLT